VSGLAWAGQMIAAQAALVIDITDGGTRKNIN
jgi:hypothetical protein